MDRCRLTVSTLLAFSRSCAASVAPANTTGLVPVPITSSLSCGHAAAGRARSLQGQVSNIFTPAHKSGRSTSESLSGRHRSRELTIAGGAIDATCAGASSVSNIALLSGPIESALQILPETSTLSQF